MSSDRLVFKLTRWVDRDFFNELLKIADYIGYYRGEGSYFRLNIRKAIQNSYTLEDIVNLLREAGVEVSNTLIDSIREEYRRYTCVTIKWDIGTSEVVVHVPWSSLCLLYTSPSPRD